jgi:hypothetical protein
MLRENTVWMSLISFIALSTLLFAASGVLDVLRA